MIRVARRAHTPRFQGAFIRVLLLLYTAHAPRGLVREHDEGEREEEADKTHDFMGATAGGRKKNLLDTMSNLLGG